jgi:segregation and condensation protein A
MAYEVKLEQFQGPFDVLLQLIEDQQLSITDIALAGITEQYIEQLNQVEERYPEELADFLVIAAKLLYLKSRALLPYLVPEEEDSAEQLAAHLRMYKEFRDATAQLTEQINQQQFMVARTVTTERSNTVEFSPPPSVTGTLLAKAYQAVIDRVEAVIRLPKLALSKAISLKEKITHLYAILQQRQQLQFSELVSTKLNRADIVITLLAVLELVKQQTVTVDQINHYSDITITRV